MGTPVNAGQSTFTFEAQDAAGNTVTKQLTFTIAAGAAPVTTTPASDTTPPSVPAGLSASAISTSQITLSWNASTDNVGVTGYKVYRSGNQIGTTPTLSYTDTNLSAGTSYSYTVAAYDAANNTSGQSGAVGVMTQSVAANPTGPSGYTFCANEYGTCSFSGTMSVAFGAGTSFYYQNLTNGTACTTRSLATPT